jgi:hypothetical protein
MEDIIGSSAICLHKNPYIHWQFSDSSEFALPSEEKTPFRLAERGSLYREIAEP